jgi:hypothetical protein
MSFIVTVENFWEGRFSPDIVVLVSDRGPGPSVCWIRALEGRLVEVSADPQMFQAIAFD